MTDRAILVDGLSKAYVLGVADNKAETLVGSLTNLVSAPLRNLRRLRRLDTFRGDIESPEVLWALRDVSFEIIRGEVVGFVGRNGAGKSTLLKVLSRIAEPTRGRIEIHGRVSSLLEVGTGFHPELTGRENVFMNGTILGMKRSEIQSKFDEIVEFSGVERFLDTPVKRYSSGMKVRLAFAVAAHLEPEILIIDEVLAVGDAEFQKKCLGKMEDVAGGGRTVLFVSHNMGALQNLCPKAIALQNGRVVDIGRSEDVVQRYLAGMSSTSFDAFGDANPYRRSSGAFRLTGGRVCDRSGEATENILSGEPACIEFDYECEPSDDELNITITIYNESGVAMASLSNGLTGFVFRSNKARGRLICQLSRLNLAQGRYRVAVTVAHMGTQLDSIANSVWFDVDGTGFYPTAKVPDPRYGVMYVQHEWRIA